MLRPATAKFRKTLRSFVRNGSLTVNYYANKAMGYPVFVKRGETLWLLHAGFETADAAIKWCAKMHATPARRIAPAAPVVKSKKKPARKAAA